MKRSYPYTGPGASPSQQHPPQASASAAPVTQQTPDYSAYGYGGNNALMVGSATPSLSQDAQQAQWHQQWQQYYAQQAANGASGHAQQSPAQNRPPHQQQPPPPQQQQQAPQMAYGFQHQQGVQAPQYYGQYQPQQPQTLPQAQPQQMQNAPYNWSNQQQTGLASFQQAPQPFHGAAGQQQAQQQSNFYNVNLNQPHLGPPAKRPRFDLNANQQNGARPLGPANPMNGQSGGGASISGMQPGASMGIGPQGGPQGFPGASTGIPAGGQNYGGNTAWQSPTAGPSAMRPGPMRGANGPMAVPHMGGPSNMAGPMAVSPAAFRPPSTPMADRRGGAVNRPGRIQTTPTRPTMPTAPIGNKFAGPVGVNALFPQGRPGFGARGVGVAVNNVGNRRTNVGPRSGVPSGPSAKGNRFDNGKGNANMIGKGGPVKGMGGFELNKAPAVNGRSSTLADQPVPPASKRTFSDFKIKAINIDPIDWQWQQPDGEEDDDDGGVIGEEEETLQTINDAESVDGSVQGRKKTRSGKRNGKNEASKETCRLRICFAANQPPLGAPTGPKALSKDHDKDKEEPDELASAVAASSTDTDAAGEPEWTAFSRGPPQSSTNRISISFAASKRRLVIDSEVIKLVQVNRAEGVLKIVVNVTTAAGLKRKDQLEKKKGEEWVVVKGVLLEGREAETDNFGAISRRELERCWRDREKVVTSGEGEAKNGQESATLSMDREVKQEGDEQTLQTELLVEAGEEASRPEAAETVKVEEGGGAEAEGTAKEEEGEGGHNEVGEEKQTEGEEGNASDAPDSGEVSWYNYASLPPFYRLLAHHEGPLDEVNHAAVGSEEMIITVQLAEQNAKQELKWVKTGDVEEWLSALPGFHSSLSSTTGLNAVHAWTNKISVVDPDPPPTVEDVLEDWSLKSFVGNLGERSRFLEEYRLPSSSDIADLICKLIRGDRANPTPNVRELGLPLQQAMEGTRFHQNHLTLSILALVRLVSEFADLAGVGKEVVDAKIQEIFMCLPTHLIFRACDGLFKETLEKQRLANIGRGKGFVAGVGPVTGGRTGMAAQELAGAAAVVGHDGSGGDVSGAPSGTESEDGMGKGGLQQTEERNETISAGPELIQSSDQVPSGEDLLADQVPEVVGADQADGAGEGADQDGGSSDADMAETAGQAEQAEELAESHSDDPGGSEEAVVGPGS